MNSADRLPVWNRCWSTLPAAVVHGSVETRQQVPVPAGDYEATLISEMGELINSVRVSVLRGETKEVSLQAEGRPRVVVQFPGGGNWGSRITRFAPGASVAGWAIASTFGGKFTVPEPAASLENRTVNEWAFRVAGPGVYQVEAGREGLDFSLSREIDVPATGEVRIRLPDLSAQLQGSMKSYKGGVGFSHHGWAGPRLAILSDSPEGWNVTVGLPERQVDDRFELNSLPEGLYHVFQHLIGENFTYRGIDDKPQERNRAKNAWGGIGIQLQKNAPARLEDFATYTAGPLRLRLTWSDGEPVRDADLYIRDRMSDAWQLIARGPTTLANASDPIPMPPVARVTNGLAELPSVRKGMLEFVLVRDDGRSVSFRRDVDPAAVTELRIERPTP